VITWDEAKRASNLAKHDLDFADVTTSISAPQCSMSTTARIMASYGRLPLAGMGRVFAYWSLFDATMTRCA
jgi:uncharacterized DUF497 family protein